MTASIISKTVKNIVAASAALIMAASMAACGPSAATPSDEGSAASGSSSSKTTARTLDEIKKSGELKVCLLYTSPSPRDPKTSRMPSSA